MPFCTPLSCGA